MKHNPEKLTKVRIEVTERLIKRGNVNNSESCPVALAVRKAVRNVVDVDVLHDDITLTNFLADEDYDDQVIPTPARVSKFIEKIDARDPDNFDDWDDRSEEPVELPPAPKPISFNLRIKNKFLKPSLRK